MAWGTYYGVLLILEKYVFGNLVEKLPYWAKRLLTMLIVIVGWVFFSAESFGSAAQYLGAMVGRFGLWDNTTGYLLWSNLLPFAVMSCSALGYFRKFPKLRNSNVRLALQAVGYAAVFVLCVISLVSDTYNPFLYFRF